MALPVSRRSMLRGLALMAIMGPLAACAQTAAPTPTAVVTKSPQTAAGSTPTPIPTAGRSSTSAHTTIRLHARLGPEDDMWAQILPKFEQAYNAKVQLEQFSGGEYIQKLQTLAAGGQMGDVIHIFTGDSSFQLFAANGVLVSLDNFIAADRFDLGQYYKYCVDSCKVDGKYYGLPFKGHPSRCGIFFNKTLFDAASVKYPTNDSTYDDLVEAAKNLHKVGSSGVEVYGWTNPGTGDLEWYIIMSRFGGGELYIENGTKSGLTDSDAQWGWAWTYNMMNVHKVMLNPLQTNPSVTDLFRSGKLAMARLNIGTKAAFASITNFKWGMTVAPKGPKGKRGTLAETDVVGLTKFSQVKDTGWKLLQYITSREAGLALAKQTGGGRSATPGARPDVYESEEFLNLPYPEGVQQNTLVAMREVEPFVQPANFRGPEVMRAIDPYYESLILNRSKPDQKFFSTMNQAVQEILDKPRP
ncbi:MAG TPA: sugar ABC transporter substrate-binding protein [Ktedonobacteraceae bacterium]|nr:sugar ABC transporter substrate-binding protein [Ktedonobacteraceae bacterium]